MLSSLENIESGMLNLHRIYRGASCCHRDETDGDGRFESSTCLLRKCIKPNSQIYMYKLAMLQQMFTRRGSVSSYVLLTSTGFTYVNSMLFQACAFIPVKHIHQSNEQERQRLRHDLERIRRGYQKLCQHNPCEVTFYEALQKP